VGGKPSTFPGKAIVAAENRLRGGCPQAHDYLRPDRYNLGFQPGLTCRDLSGVGFLVNPAFPTLLEFEVFDDVGDVNIGPIDASFYKRPIEQFSGWSYEWESLQVLVVAGLLTDKNDGRARRPCTENRLGCVPVKIAGLATLRGVFKCA